MTTIKLKNGSGAPSAGNLVQGEPALDLTNKRLYTEDSSGAVIEVGINPGASGAVTLNHSGNAKLATASTGIDVTGTVTADGLTVDGLTQLNTNNLSNGLTISGNDNANVKVRFDNTGTSGGDFVIQGGIAGASNQGLSIRDLDNSAQRIHINSGGDILFYEDTGTTAKFFWDSSAESLGIGTSSPSAALDVSYGDYQNSGAIKIGADLGQNTSKTDASRKFGAITAAHFDNDEADLGLITMDSSSASVSALTIGGGSSSFSSASTINFQTSSDGSSAGTNAMTIDASRNVGIGTSSPTAKLSLQTATGTNNTSYNIIDATTDNPTYKAQINLVREDSSGKLGWAFLTNNVGSPTERMRIDASGNVLIGSIGSGTSSATPVELNLGSTFANSVGSLAKAKLKVFEDTGANVYGLSVSSGLFEYGVPSSGAHAFFVNESEKMRLDSEGLKFNGDTAAANALDDYEEGTWTPTVTGATGTTIDVAEYTKIGRLVTIDLRVRWTGSPNDSTPLNFSLPFASQNATSAARTGLVFYNGTSLLGGNAISSHISQGSSNVTFYNTGGGTFRSVLASDINSAYDWLITVSYFT